MSKYSSNSGDLPIGDILIHAPSGAGKTFLAATISEHFPEKEGVKASLDDMLWLLFDLGGLNGFKESGLSVPVIDMRAMVSEMGLLRAIQKLKEEVSSAMTSATKYLVVDTVSAFDEQLCAFWDAKMPDEAQSMRKFGNIANGHSYFHQSLMGLPVLRIWLCHSKSAVNAVETAASKAAKLTHQSDPGKIQPEITGKSRSLYVKHSSLECVIRATPIPGQKRGPGAVKRVLLPYGDSMFEGKCRWQGSLDSEEEPHLGKLIQKIRKNGG